ncbi:HNH endonuclease signature motif containing protein [Cryobacterium psychrophilum]|uniref:HNH endonuclease n=1 Tax=Cryobacterium psychrophilum TaxID=41988 RepID=A0A4Y8KTK4_9MICO|nr:HNH endonuclease signature motif containing protein [Cryobacterium psychrophilum]TFD79977.1 HNH endonuclease [Cryobacterium psychrophilum]
MFTTVKSGAEMVALLLQAGELVTAALAGVQFSLLDDDDALSVMGALEAVGRRVDGGRISSAANVAFRADSGLGHDSLAWKNGCRGKFELITGVTRISSSEAKRRMRLGGTITGVSSATSGLVGQVMPVRHPAVAESLAAGELGIDAADVIVTALEQISTRVAPDDLDRAERALVASATGAITPETEGLPGAGIAFSADLIRAQAHEWAAMLDPDGAAPSDDKTAAKSTFGFGLLRDGLYPLRGGVTPDLRGVMNGVFNTFLSAHAAPAFPSAEDQARLEAGELIPGAEEAVDDRTGGEKCADILRAVFEKTARDPKTPTMGGAAPVVMVHVNARDLKNGRGVGWIDGVDAPISLRSVNQRLCAGGYQQVIIGDDGHVLHLGAKERFFSPAQRRAIAARDGGCVIPGCKIAAAWCEVHHVIPWQSHGLTDVENGVLLCWFHHHTIDTAGWDIRMINGRPHLRGPVLFDPTRTWRPAASHRANTPSADPPWSRI